MGWSSGTRVFDVVAKAVIEGGDKEAALESIINELEDMDWDCQSESEYWNHPMVQKIMKKLHPSWFD